MASKARKSVSAAKRSAVKSSGRKKSSKKNNNEARLRAAFSQTYSFMVLMTPDGTITEVNRAVQDAVGLAPKEIEGMKFWDLWSRGAPEEETKLKAMVRRAARGESVREECRYWHCDGAMRSADRTLSPVKDENGEVVLIVGTGVDVTVQKQLLEHLEGKVMERTRELNEKNAEIAEQARRLRDLSTRLLRVQDDERRRIARELHDSAGQQLAALAMNFYVIRAGTGGLSDAQQKAIKESGELVAQLTEEVRTMSYLLHPPLLDETGLAPALRWYVDGFSKRSKIAVTVDIEDNFGRLATEIETTLFRIVQESLTNVHRHSKSATAGIRLMRRSNEVLLEVLDTGIGLQPRKNETKESAPAGVGILGMSERVRQLGGDFRIEAANPGTRIVASMPVRLREA